MPFDFPSSPSIGQIFNDQWKYDGEKWGGYDATMPTALRRNHVINPAQQHSQENGATAVTTSGAYPADQWPAYSSVGFDAALQIGSINQIYIRNTAAKVSLAAADFVYLNQPIEGHMVKDFGWGQAYALPGVLRFEAYCTVAGTYAATIRSSSATPDRSFVFLFTLAASTWTTFEVAIPAQTGGTWATDAALGMRLDFSLAAGSTYTAPAVGWNNGNYLGATGMSNGIASAGTLFYVRRVSLHLDPDGTGRAPPFELPNHADELDRCQRYFEPMGMTDLFIMTRTSGGQGGAVWWFNTTKRIAPTITFTTSGTGVSAYMPVVSGVEFLQTTIALAAIQSAKAVARM